MTTFLTSDSHWGHPFVSRLRGFDTVDEHDQWLTDQWNKTVAKDDEVWHLGDISLKKVQHFADWFEGLNGTKHVVLGNHCTSWPGMKGWMNQWKKLAPLCGFIGTEAILRVEGFRFRLSHFPIKADHGEVRYPEWRPTLGENEFLLHGHTHSITKWTSPREIHVGVDAWGKPVPIQTITRTVKDWLDNPERQGLTFRE